jgi:hypothetical protein
MAQTKKKRRRKHKGTQGGSIDSGRRASRPRSREEAKARARSRRKQPATRGDRPPTWRSAIIRGAVAAVVFTILLAILFNRSIGSAIGLGLFMLVIYIPAGYYIDLWVWRKRERMRIRAAEEGK